MGDNMKIEQMTNYDQYMLLSAEDKEQLFGSYNYGEFLKYFGGKAKFRPVILRTILNVASNAYEQTKTQNGTETKPIFIEAFAGGGKLALCVPQGLFSKIIINDIDPALTTLYKIIQSDSWKLLISAIHDLCKVADNDLMLGLNNSIIDFYDEAFKKHQVGQSNITNYDILIAAVRFVTIYGSMYGSTKEGTSFTLASYDDVYRSACRVIPDIHKRLSSMNMVIENLDYKELIKKYNGKSYLDRYKNEHRAEEITRAELVYYFDPPYYEGALSKAGEGYVETFTTKQTNELTDILANSYRPWAGLNIDMKYWVKSDYQPYPWDPNGNIFASIENNPMYKKFDIGTSGEAYSNNKGASKSKHEYIWVKGLV